MWIFEISTGKMFDPNGALHGEGYAGGDCGRFPDAINNPAWIIVHNAGPLPPGQYTLAELLPQSHLGPNAIRLDPDSTNEMFGRSGFFIHADLADRATHPRSASEGCIVYDARMAMWESQDHRLRVAKVFDQQVKVDPNFLI